MMQGDAIIPGTARRQRLARICQRTGLLPWLGAARSWRGEDLRILAYHRVLDSVDPPGFTFDVDLISASKEAFRAQMKLLRSRFTPMRFDEVIDRIERGRRVPPKAVLVTFDDGYDDNHDVAYPILREMGVSAMFFVSTGHIDSGAPYVYDWLVHMVISTQAQAISIPELDLECVLPAGIPARRVVAARVLNRIKALDDAEQRSLISRLETAWGMPSGQGHASCRPMTWDQLRDMRRNGMEIGAHSVNHTMLSKVSHEEMVAEIRDSAATLQQQLGEPARVMSYPVGGTDAYDDVVIETARDAGFKLACSYISGASNLRRDRLHALRRLPVEREMEPRWFEAMLSLPEIFSYPMHVRDR